MLHDDLRSLGFAFDTYAAEMQHHEGVWFAQEALVTIARRLHQAADAAQALEQWVVPEHLRQSQPIQVDGVIDLQAARERRQHQADGTIRGGPDDGLVG